MSAPGQGAPIAKRQGSSVTVERQFRLLTPTWEDVEKSFKAIVLMNTAKEV